LIGSIRRECLDHIVVFGDPSEANARSGLTGQLKERHAELL
jgi:hypothetical protein